MWREMNIVINKLLLLCAGRRNDRELSAGGILGRLCGEWGQEVISRLRSE